MRLVSGHNSHEEVVHAERVRIAQLQGLVNAAIGKRPQKGRPIKVKFDPEAILFIDGLRLNFSPPVERGSYLTTLLLLLRDKYPEIAREAAFHAVELRGDKFGVQIDSLPPILGCTAEVEPAMVAP
jgi:hypothetical protein